MKPFKKKKKLKNKRPTKVKQRKVKAYAWIENEELVQDGVDYKIHNNSTYKGTRGNDISIIPCTITYSLITVQKEIKKYTDDTTLYAKDSITFNDKEYSISEWKEFVERVRKVNKRFNNLNK